MGVCEMEKSSLDWAIEEMEQSELVYKCENCIYNQNVEGENIGPCGQKYCWYVCEIAQKYGVKVQELA